MNYSKNNLAEFNYSVWAWAAKMVCTSWAAAQQVSRWAILAVAGILIPEWLESLGLNEDFDLFNAGSWEYFADPTTLFVVQLALMGWDVERRWADYLNSGCEDIEPKLPHKKNPKPDVGYLGELWFDPLNCGEGHGSLWWRLGQGDQEWEACYVRLCWVLFLGYLSRGRSSWEPF